MVGRGLEHGHDRLDPDLRSATEAWFLSRGLPHFVRDYTATGDIFTRSASFLSLVFLFEMLGALNLAWAWWANVLAVAGGMVVLIAAWALVNGLRGRARFARPDDVGPVELTVFVVVPALVPLLFGGQVRAAGATLVSNLVVLGLVYVVTSYALFPMTRWGFEQMVRHVSQIGGLFARTLPLFLVFATFVFINAEMWQVAADFVGLTFAATVGLLVAVVVVFQATQLPREVAAVSDVSAEVVPELCAGSPLEGLARPAAGPALRPRERGNVVLVLLVAQGVQLAMVSGAIGAFFVVFGVVAVTPGVTAAWTGDIALDPLLTLTLGDRALVVTDTLLYVSGFLAAFAALYFTVQTVTDEGYRSEVLGPVTAEVREAVAVRAAYRDLLPPE